MQEAEFYFLPGLEDYGRLAVVRNNGRAGLFWQVLAPRAWADMTQNRPVEEMPRLLGRYSAAHHLAAARLLDRLFGVEPPPLAVNLRELLRQVDIYRQHLRRFYFLLLLTQEQPRARRRPAGGPGAWIPEIQQHLALAREAAAIVGGRPEHPLTAVVGGVSRYLKPEHYPRLKQIGTALAAFTWRLADFLDKEVLAAEKLPAWGTAVLPSVVTLSTDGQQLHLRWPEGQEQWLPLKELWPHLAWQQEAWTYEPLVFWQANGGTSEAASGLVLLVGPTARLLSEAAPTTAAEPGKTAKPPTLSSLTLPISWEARRREMLAAVTTFADLAQEDKLTGPDLRTIPSGFGEEAQAAVEGPDGLIQVACRVDHQGRVQELRLLDPALAHQALKQAILQVLAKDLPARPLTRAEQARLTLSLLPW